MNASSTPTVRSDVKCLVYLVFGADWCNLLSKAVSEQWPAVVSEQQTYIQSIRQRMNKVLGLYGLDNVIAEHDEIVRTIHYLMRAGMPRIVSTQSPKEVAENGPIPLSELTISHPAWLDGDDDPFFTPVNALVRGLRAYEKGGIKRCVPDYVLFGALSISMCRLAVDVLIPELGLEGLDSAELLIGAADAAALAEKYAEKKRNSSKPRKKHHPELYDLIMQYAVGTKAEYGSLTSGKAAKEIFNKFESVVRKSYPNRETA